MQRSVRLEEDEENSNRSCHVTDRYAEDFYTAIMEEDLGRIEDMTRTHGSNNHISMKNSALGKPVMKGIPILPLHVAAAHRRVHSMQTLLSAGADPEIRDRLGRTTLHLVINACANTQTARPKASSKFQTTVTEMQRQVEACLRVLCEAGVNIGARMEGPRRLTPLHLSVSYKAAAAVRILTSFGADVDAVDGAGMTPLHMAAGILDQDVLVCLLHQGADINKGVMHSGNTALHLAVLSMAMTRGVQEEAVDCVCQLLKQGADPNAVNHVGRTPLHEACSLGNTELVDLLLRAGANVNKLSKSGENGLFLFLDHRPNVSNSSLLGKLLGLTSPLTLHNLDGHLPKTLTRPCFLKQRDQLLQLTQQPRRLEDICKADIYLKYIQGRKKELTRMLPERLYDFVFNHWDNAHNISFESEDELDSFSEALPVTTS